MSKLELSYSTFGLTEIDFLESIDAVDAAGYSKIELSFHRDHFNPFNLTDDYLATVKKRFERLRVKPGCIATASHFFTPSRPHEPSLICTEAAGRKRRIDLIRRGIDVARTLGVNLVSFGSGFIREDHVRIPSIDPFELLVDSVGRCLAELRSDEDITLMMEPEPGMFIETMEQATRLVDAVGSERFRLHLDLCHMYCSEPDYLAALAAAAPYARYLHVSDAQMGSNIKIVAVTEHDPFDLDFARYLVYFPERADFLFVDRDTPLFFSDETPGKAVERRVERILADAGVNRPFTFVNYRSLSAAASSLDDEIFTYLISVPRLSFDVLERSRPIFLYLRTARSPSGRPYVDKLLANTITGITHFHDIPGEGVFDFAASFDTLIESGFTGIASVELYHHLQSWKNALVASYRHLSKFVQE